MEKLSFEEGKFAVKFARTNIEKYLSGINYVIEESQNCKSDFYDCKTCEACLELPPIFNKPRACTRRLKLKTQKLGSNNE